VRTEGMVGEVFVGGATGLKLTRGNLRVRDGSGRQLVVAGLKPVFVPKRPAVAGPLFTSDVAAGTIPDGAKAIFSARGESLGYLDPEGQFVVSPGYTSDLTRPFAPRIVQAALANVPPKDRADAELLFDVNGEYVGYVVGPVFYAQTELAAGAAVSGASRIDRGAASVAPGAIAGTAAAGGAAVHRSGSVGTTGTEVAAGTAVHEAGTAGPAGAGVKAFSLNGDNGCATPIDPKDRRCF
jgi:hypothetical protein